MAPETLLTLRNAARHGTVGGRFMLPLRILRRLFYGTPGEVTITDFDGNLSIDLRLSEHMQSRIFWVGYYSREVVAALDQLLQPGMVVVDIGANIGEISMVAANRVGTEGQVVAFEPVASHADRLESHLRRNGLQWVHVERMALSDHDGELPMFDSCGQGSADDEHSGLNSLYGGQDGSTQTGTVRVTTLDDYLDAHPLHRVDLIKIDIEGAELPCLVGARRTLARHLPYLVIEVQEASARIAGYEHTAILDELERHGYRFRQLTANGLGRSLDTGNLGEYQNVLCVPPTRPAP
jgi:FkbM family methyltransferase